MTESLLHRAMVLFESVYDLEPSERALRLEQDCRDDPTLRAEVESLLAAHSQVPVIFEAPSFDALSQVPTPDESWIGRQVGAYKVVRRVASGGMGTVYEGARADDQYEKTVAIKLLHRGLASNDVLRRFRNERQALANLDHPYVARLHDGGVTQDGLPYLVMEYITGRPLIQYCNEERLTVAERLELFQKICHAVHYAHQHLIVHRDLKPNNILVTEDGNPKLLDFGIAKILAPDSTEQARDVTITSAPAFTPDYASPEQIRSDLITTASDVYSLGVVLYELLTGHRPYRLSNRTFGEIEQIVCEQMPEKPSTVATRPEEVLHPDGRTRTTISPDAVSAARNTTPLTLRRSLRGELDTIMMMAMRKEPNRRYASAEQFSEDIRRYLNRLPLFARTDTLGYRGSRFIARNKTGVLAATLIALSLIGGLAGVAVQRDVARANARRAEEVSKFLIDLFAVSDPRHSLGEDITAREMLDRGAERIRTELQDQPLTQATLMNTMGAAYMSLGLYPPSARLLEEALSARRRLLGDEHLEVAETLITLSSLRIKTGDYASAETLSREGLQIQRTLLGEIHVDVAGSLNNLGRALQKKGDYAGAEAALRSALDMRRRLLGDDHPDVAMSRNNLAGLLFANGDPGGAETLLRQALEVQRRLQGNMHPDVATTLGNLALALHMQGDLEAAEPLYLEVLDLRRKLLGEEHPEVADTLSNIGELDLQRGKPQLAEERFRKALDLRRAAYGPEHPTVALSLNDLGSALRRQGRYEEAKALMRESLELRRKLLPAQHPALAVSLNGLAVLHMDTGDPQAAEPLLRESTRICDAALPKTHRVTENTSSLLGRCLAALKRYEEAEPLLRASYEVFTTAGGDRSAGAQSALRRLVELYDDWAGPDVADTPESLRRRRDAAKYRALLASLEQSRTPQPPPDQSE